MNDIIFFSLYNLAHQSQTFDSLVWFVAVPLIYLIMFLVAGFFFVDYKIYQTKNIKDLFVGRNREIILIFFTTGLAWFVAKVLKILIHTDRPFILFSNVHALFSETGYAFPSGHATAISALAMAVYFRHRKFGSFCLVVALLIGLARIIAGVHFPIDILGGFVLGVLIAFFTKTL